MEYSDGFRFERDTVLWRQDEPSDGVLVVCTGAMLLKRQEADGSTTVLGLVTRGRMVGVEGALGDWPRLSECVGVVPGRARMISHDRLNGLLARHPEHWRRLLQASSEQAWRLATRMDVPGRAGVGARLARLLLVLDHEVGLPDARGRLLPLALHGSDYGALLGCRVETVARHFARWRRDSLIERLHEGLLLRDLEGLSDVAGVAPDSRQSA